MADPGPIPPPAPGFGGFGGLGGLGGLGGGFGGFGGFPGLGGLGGGAGVNFDAGFGGGLGGPGLGYAGFGGPGGGGFGGGWAPYVPVTPLGALGGVKGDLIVPIVAVGVALFILLIIFLAVKAALAWKVEMADNMWDHKVRRQVVDTPPVHDEEHMSELAKIVINALDSESCLDKIICSIGAYGQGSSWTSYFAMMESLMPENYKHSLTTLKSCAEGSVKVQEFRCGRDDDDSIKVKQNQQSNQQGAPADALQGKNATSTPPKNSTSTPLKNATSQLPSKNPDNSFASNEINHI